MKFREGLKEVQKATRRHLPSDVLMLQMFLICSYSWLKGLSFLKARNYILTQLSVFV